jgi:hypothetical protein
MQVDFEDIATSAPITYNRYGFTTSEFADPAQVREGVSRSQWQIPLGTEPVRYNLDVTFDEITETTVEKFVFQLGGNNIVTYIDSVSLTSVADLEMADAVSVKEAAVAASVTVSPVPAVDVINVAGANANASVEVYNSVGQKVAVAKAGANGDATIAVSSFAKGLYFVKTSGAVVKFVK